MIIVHDMHKHNFTLDPSNIWQAISSAFHSRLYSGTANTNAVNDNLVSVYGTVIGLLGMTLTMHELHFIDKLQFHECMHLFTFYRFTNFQIQISQNKKNTFTGMRFYQSTHALNKLQHWVDTNSFKF